MVLYSYWYWRKERITFWICNFPWYILFFKFLARWNWWQKNYSFRWFEHAAESYVKVPFFGAVSHLTLAVSPFCIAFAVLWGYYRKVSFAWIGQDILVRNHYLSSKLFSSQGFNLPTKIWGATLMFHFMFIVSLIYFIYIYI